MSELKIEGKLTKILDPVNGTSKAGKEWNKQDFVITTHDSFPKDICFSLFGNKISVLNNAKIGDNVVVYFNLESREYEGRYFHNVNAWKMDVRPPIPHPNTGAKVSNENDIAEQHNKQYQDAKDVDENQDLPF